MGTKRATLTHDMLMAWGACGSQRGIFRKQFPNGVAPETLNDAKKVARLVALAAILPVDYLEEKLTKRGAAAFEAAKAAYAENYHPKSYALAQEVFKKRRAELYHINSYGNPDRRAYTAEEGKELQALATARDVLVKWALSQRTLYLAESLAVVVWSHGWAKPTAKDAADNVKQARAYDRSVGKSKAAARL